MTDSSFGSLARHQVYNDAVLGSAEDLMCFSHLRWDFVFQRPQHLMTRCARHRRVFFVEEPTFGASSPTLDVSDRGDRIHVLVPRLPSFMEHDETHRVAAQTNLLLDFASHRPVRNLISWYYTPVALPYTRSLLPRAVVYDCMDDLSGFAGANPALPLLEEELFRIANVVFTGGHSLYRAKRHLHHNVHAYPSGVDTEHFGRARAPGKDPADQAAIPHPRAGFAGVIDERLDLELLRAVAAAHPRMQFVMIGPIVKIDAASVPRAPNIWYLGQKSYSELPSYQAGWDVAIMPFAHNAATRCISPTKTLEYLAAGRPVVSTSIADVLEPYGTSGLAHIADSPSEFVKAIDTAMAEDAAARWDRADAFLRQHSWDETWLAMSNLLRDVMPTVGHSHWDSLRTNYS